MAFFLSIWADLSTSISDLGLLTKVYAQIHYPWIPETVLSLFAAINTVRVIAYVPQITRAARDQNGATAISYTTWGLFFVSHLSTIAYALVCQGDALLALIFLGNAIACLAIIAVTFFKRRRHRQFTRHGLFRNKVHEDPVLVPLVSQSEASLPKSND
jgi:hypothetical protein